MKKAAGLLLLLGITAWFFLDTRPPVVDFPRAGKHVIAFGDSLVTGYGASSGKNFIAVLSDRVGQPILNRGINGDTTRTGLERLEEDVLSQDPRIVILLLGGNDALRRVPENETFERISSMIDQIHRAGAAVILLGVRGSLLGDRYQDHFERIATAKQVNYIPDILQGIFGHPGLMADAIHPNDEGHSLMADRVEPVLRELLASP